MVVRVLPDVRQATIRPVIGATVAKGAPAHADEYGVCARLEEWGYDHEAVCRGRGEYARGDDGDGSCGVHVDTAEGLWSLLRSWLRPHRGISQEKPPACLGFSQAVHDARRRGKEPLGTLVTGPVAQVRVTTPKPDKSLLQFGGQPEQGERARHPGGA